MSRCFPYPPPGFEKKVRSTRSDLLAKEKQKEREHKKEKRDKEKKEGKEKKDKDKSKDKHKGKKDRKERHKDKKRYKDKNRTSDDKRIEGQTGSHNEQKVGSTFSEELGKGNEGEKGAANGMPQNTTGSISKVEEVNNSRYMEELGRRIEVEKKAAASRMLENITDSVPKRIKSLGTSTALEKESSNGKTVVPNFVCKEQRKADKVSRPVENVNHNHQGLSNGNPMVRNSSKKQQEGFGQPMYKGNHTHQALSHRNPLLSNFISTEQRRIDEITRAVEKGNRNHQALLQTPNQQALLQTPTEKDEVKSAEGKEKREDREADNGHGDRHKDREREKKNKGREKHRDKEKKKEEERMKKTVNGENSHNGHDTPKDSGRDQVDCLKFKPLSPHNNSKNFAGNHGNSKKRKETENGFLHEGEVLPNKLSRPASSSHQQNGKTLEFDRIHKTYASSIRNETPNNIKVEKLMNNKEHMINGTATAQSSSAGLKPPFIADASRKSKVSSKPAHPDSEFLSQIYYVPKIDKWPEYDDQEWLFSSNDHHLTSNVETEVEEITQVWAEGLKIESADVFALPYVIPY